MNREAKCVNSGGQGFGFYSGREADCGGSGVSDHTPQPASLSPDPQA